MYIKRRSVSALYKLAVSVLALVGLLLELASFGTAAWRLFAPWVILLAAVYFLIAAIMTAFFKRRSPVRMLCPMLQGLLTISGLVIAVGYLLVITGHSGIPSLAGFAGVLTYFIVPLLILGDWLLFSKKGQWRTVDPFYWLAFPVIYACGILLSANFTTRVIILEYPYEFLNYPVIGIDTMLWWGAVLGILILAGGYLLMMLDLLWSGKLAQHIVMPRIKTIVVEEVIEEVEEEPEPRQKVEKVAKHSVEVKKPIDVKQSVNSKQSNIKSKKSAQSPKVAKSQKSQSKPSLQSVKPTQSHKKSSKSQAKPSRSV